MSWKDTRVFVTGATGIVGSWLVKRLIREGAHVVVLVRDWDPQSELVRSGDIPMAWYRPRESASGRLRARE
jgi:CDP-glucose 4,6-dehydratase